MKSLTLLVTVLALLNANCASVDLNPAGQNIQVVETVDSNCKSLGMVVGQGGSSWTGGAYYKNSSLLMYAQNDLRNNAAALGATHVVLKTSNFGQTGNQYGSTVTGANISGTAYKCN
jgi:hypothetical protein